MTIRFDRNNRFDYYDLVSVILKENITFGKLITPDGRLAGNDTSLAFGITVEEGKVGDYVKCIKAGKIMSTSGIFIENTIYYCGVNGDVSLIANPLNPQIIGVGLSSKELLIDISLNRIGGVISSASSIVSEHSTFSLTDDGTNQTLTGNLGDLIIKSLLNTVIKNTLESNGIENTGEILTETLNINNQALIDNYGNFYSKNILIDGYIQSDNSFDIKFNKSGNTTLKIYNALGNSFVEIQNLTMKGNIDLTDGNIVNLSELILNDGLLSASIKVNADSKIEISELKVGNIEITGLIDGVDISLFKSDYDSKINQALKTTSDVTFNSVKTDSILENTSNNGVNIDGVTLKDGLVNGYNIGTIYDKAHAQNTDTGTSNYKFIINKGTSNEVSIYVDSNGILNISKSNESVYTGLKVNNIYVNGIEISTQTIGANDYINVPYINIDNNIIVDGDIIASDFKNNADGVNVNFDIYNSTGNSTFKITNSDGVFVAVTEVDELIINSVRLKYEDNILQFKDYLNTGFYKSIKVNDIYSTGLITSTDVLENSGKVYVNKANGKLYSVTDSSTLSYTIDSNSVITINVKDFSIEKFKIEILEPITGVVLSVGNTISDKDILNDTNVVDNSDIVVMKNINNTFVLNVSITSGKLKIIPIFSNNEYFTYNGTTIDIVHRQNKYPNVKLIEDNELVYPEILYISNDTIRVSTAILITGQIIIN